MIFIALLISFTEIIHCTRAGVAAPGGYTLFSPRRLQLNKRRGIIINVLYMNFGGVEQEGEGRAGGRRGEEWWERALMWAN